MGKDEEGEGWVYKQLMFAQVCVRVRICVRGRGRASCMRASGIASVGGFSRDLMLFPWCGDWRRWLGWQKQQQNGISRM